MMITVFTPVYNRASYLHKVCESLCEQTFRDFEWLVVDDGSTDGTASVVEKLKMKIGDAFPVRYYYQENGGKHRAINHGVREAQGELFLILDSDDSLPSNALERISFYYEQVRGDRTLGGVCGRMAHHDKTIIGTKSAFSAIDVNSLELRYRLGIEGDLLEVFRTDVLRETPFPEITGEKFVPEALVWNRIARNYKLRMFNEVVYYRDYLNGGLTDKIVKIRMNSPVASMMTYAELNGYDIPFMSKAKAAINYWRFRYCAKHLNDNVNYPKLKWWWNWVMPIGFLFHLKDVRMYL